RESLARGPDGAVPRTGKERGIGNSQDGNFTCCFEMGLLLFPSWEWCCMRVIAQNTLVEYWARHPDARISLIHWYQVTKGARWEQTQDILVSFSKAKVL